MLDGGELADAGVAPDAALADAGQEVDAGLALDAGLLVDAGLLQDGGALTDAGLDGDAGAASDAGVSLIDGGLLVDAGAPADAGVSELTDCPEYPGDGDADDYSEIEHLRDEALRAALLARVDRHNSLGYENAKVALFGDGLGDGGIDVRDGGVECAYTARTFAPELLDRTGGYNVEHSWPQSEGASEPVPRSDMHHLFPVERGWNSARGTLSYGNTDCVATACRRFEGGSEIGPRIGGAEFVMEVRPERRGDIARAHFYFAVRYALPIPNAEESALRRWHHCDPPDALEQDRNDAIESQQGNRNPFVDRPEFVDYITDF